MTFSELSSPVYYCKIFNIANQINIIIGVLLHVNLTRDSTSELKLTYLVNIRANKKFAVFRKW